MSANIMAIARHGYDKSLLPSLPNGRKRNRSEQDDENNSESKRESESDNEDTYHKFKKAQKKRRHDNRVRGPLRFQLAVKLGKKVTQRIASQTIEQGTSFKENKKKFRDGLLKKCKSHKSSQRKKFVTEISRQLGQPLKENAKTKVTGVEMTARAKGKISCWRQSWYIEVLKLNLPAAETGQKRSSCLFFMNKSFG